MVRGQTVSKSRAGRLLIIVLGVIVLGPVAERMIGAASLWTPSGPYGGDVRGLAAGRDGREFFAITAGIPGQVYRSSSPAAPWRRAAYLPEALYDIGCDPLHPAVVFVLGTTALFRSRDLGSTWMRCPLPAGCSAEQGRLAVHPDNPKVLWAAGRMKRNDGKESFIVLRSADTGGTWTAAILPAFLTGQKTCCLAVSPSDPNLLFAGGDLDGVDRESRLFRSGDGGRHWTDVTGPIASPPLALAVHPLDSYRAYIATAKGIYLSRDQGRSWRQAGGKAFGTALAMDPARPRTIRAGADRRVFTSLDGGERWTECSAGLFGTCRRIVLAADRIFFASSAGIFRSDDGGASWDERNSGLAAAQVISLGMSPSRPLILYAGIRGNGLFKTADGAASWERLPGFYRAEIVIRIVVDPADAARLFVLTGG